MALAAILVSQTHPLPPPLGTHPHTLSLTHTHARTHARTHAYTHARTHTSMHAHMHALTLIHTHVQRQDAGCRTPRRASCTHTHTCANLPRKPKTTNRQKNQQDHPSKFMCLLHIHAETGGKSPSPQDADDFQTVCKISDCRLILLCALSPHKRHASHKY